MSAGSELSITFRTTKRSGLLFYAANRNRSQRMVIEQVNGQVRNHSTNFIGLQRSNSKHYILNENFFILLPDAPFVYSKQCPHKTRMG